MCAQPPVFRFQTRTVPSIEPEHAKLRLMSNTTLYTTNAERRRTKRKSKEKKQQVSNSVLQRSPSAIDSSHLFACGPPIPTCTPP